LIFQNIKTIDKVKYFDLIKAAYNIFYNINKFDFILLNQNIKGYNKVVPISAFHDNNSYIIEPIISSVEKITSENNFKKLINNMNECFNYSYIITYVSVAEILINKYDFGNTYLIVKDINSDRFKIVQKGKRNNVNKIRIDYKFAATQNSQSIRYYFDISKPEDIIKKENNILKDKIKIIKDELNNLKSVKEAVLLTEAFATFHTKIGLDEEMITYLLKRGSIGIDFKLDIIPKNIILKYKHLIDILKQSFKKFNDVCAGCQVRPNDYHSWKLITSKDSFCYKNCPNKEYFHIN